VIPRRDPHIALAAALSTLALAVLLLAAGCSQASPPSEAPGITGSVTSLVPGDGRPASMLVESTGTQPAGALSDKAQITIPPATQFFGADDRPAPLSEIAAIKKGTRVRVWFEGAVAESYPIQGSAKAVQLLKE
jgi:hypothetical protein